MLTVIPDPGVTTIPFATGMSHLEIPTEGRMTAILLVGAVVDVES